MNFGNEKSLSVPPSLLTRFAGFAGNVNNMLGAGIFSTPGIVWQKVGSPGATLILWILGGFISMCGSLTYVEFGLITLESGGEVAFFKKAFPKPKRLMSHIFSFVWVRPTSLAAVLQAFSQYFLFTILQHPNENEKIENFEKYCNDVRGFQKQLHSSDIQSLDFWRIKAIDTLINAAFITVLQPDEVIKFGKDPNEVIAGFFGKRIFGDIFSRVLTLLVSLSAFGAASSMTWSGSRVIVASARDDLLPFFPVYLRQLHDDYLTPFNALLAQFIWSVIVFIAVGAFSTDSFKVLSDFNIYLVWIFYLCASIGLLWLKYKKPNLHRSFTVWWGLTVIFMLSAVFIIIGNTMTPDKTQYSDDTGILGCQEDTANPPEYIKSLYTPVFIQELGWVPYAKKSDKNNDRMIDYTPCPSVNDYDIEEDGAIRNHMDEGCSFEKKIKRRYMLQM
ncbi:14310_t:CDS:10 [Entrophospora sp. SA101]|nr:14310_t:CDS:10 [Entrophospora sp. SA101]